MTSWLVVQNSSWATILTITIATIIIIVIGIIIVVITYISLRACRRSSKTSLQIPIHSRALSSRYVLRASLKVSGFLLVESLIVKIARP